jgi:hypothetical protein
MHRQITAAAALTCLLATPLYAQTATGTGVGISGSNSQSGAASQSNNAGIGNSTATGTGISGADSRSASGALAAGNQVNIAAAPANQTVTSNVNSRISGSTTVKTNPSLAMGLAAAGLETCLGSASGGLSLAGFGAVGGSTYTDEGCQARLDSRTLWSYGLKGAAVARLCARAEMWRSMPAECERYWPPGVPLPAGIVVAGPRANIMMATGGDGSGAMRVIDGRDGIEKDCLNYSAAKQKCFQWAGERPRQRTAAITPAKNLPKPKPAATQAKPEPTPAAKPAEPKPETEKKS